MSDIAIRVENVYRLYRISRAYSRGDSLRSQRHDTLHDALAARFRREDQRTTRQLPGESHAIAGDLERAAALWRTVGVSRGQLGLRTWRRSHCVLD